MTDQELDHLLELLPDLVRELKEARAKLKASDCGKHSIDETDFAGCAACAWRRYHQAKEAIAQARRGAFEEAAEIAREVRQLAVNLRGDAASGRVFACRQIQLRIEALAAKSSPAPARFGAYEGGAEAPACDDCCGHGCEDGKCVKLSPLVPTTAEPAAVGGAKESPPAVSASSGAVPISSAAGGDVVADSPDWAEFCRLRDGLVAPLNWEAFARDWYAQAKLFKRDLKAAREENNRLRIALETVAECDEEEAREIRAALSAQSDAARAREGGGANE